MTPDSPLARLIHAWSFSARATARVSVRFGQYWKQINRLRAHVEQVPTERGELIRLCSKLGLPGDFDIAQITWRPDYDAYYHDQLTKRACTMLLFRDEYIFDLENSVVVEVPEAGHATYIFAEPADPFRGVMAQGFTEVALTGVAD